ncbi:PP2C family protein-serine/threonine phosphatase [Nocardia inohanensis]|uniref:PP2C family protein-serine/threonine phosphatase n=1 Tax=Nocardia inohanensis TaxID=209246 RepID=UPI000B27F6FC|nr:protein phosphatase 2C domain-containing protein [Nocardia inohanensis]
MDTAGASAIPPTASRAAITAASATRRGGRSLNADAVGSHAEPGSGRIAFAVADGIGDQLLAARAARGIAAVAAREAATHGARAGILAAQRDLLREFPQPEADAVVVVAVLPDAAQPDGPIDVAWVGDCRAYRWNGRILHQITTDHTVAEYLSSRGLAPTARMSHLVTTSVRTVAPDAIGQALTGLSRGRLLLCSDGVHKPLDIAELKLRLAQGDSLASTANDLVDTALQAGGSDNSTAFVIERR